MADTPVNGRIDRLIERVTRVEEQTKAAARAAEDCSRGLEKLREGLDDRAEERRVERKQDRRWMVGTGIAVATMVIAAMAIIVQVVG